MVDRQFFRLWECAADYLADRILTISLSIYSASDAVTERSYATTTRSYRTHPRRHTHDTTRDTVRTMASRHPSHEANEIGVAEPPAEKRVNILDDLLSDLKGASRDASYTKGSSRVASKSASFKRRTGDDSLGAPAAPSSSPQPPC